MATTAAHSPLTFRRYKGLSLGRTPADVVQLVGAHVHPEVFAAVLSEALVAEEGVIAGDAEDGGDPVAGTEQASVDVGVIVLVLHLNLHSYHHVVPGTGHRSLEEYEIWV